MKVFVAGATGALGRALVPQLVAQGHEVVGMTRTASKQEGLRASGARAVVADALDPDAVAQAVASAEPDVIVHELTALSGPMRIRDARRPDRSVAVITTNRLRTEATDLRRALRADRGDRRDERANARQLVEPVVRGLDRLGEAPVGTNGRVIDLSELNAIVAGAGAKRGDRVGAALGIAAGHRDGRAAARQGVRDVKADPGRGAGDQGAPAAVRPRRVGVRVCVHDRLPRFAVTTP
jgi:NAD(P)-dependent dehydrogenase (short-subunit alcohol dehydrogenase family)